MEITRVARIRAAVSPSGSDRIAAMVTVLVAVAIWSPAVAHAGPRSPVFTPSDCASLVGLSLPNAAITAATSVPASGSAPGYCRVLATAAFETDIEVRMPETWHARLLHVGGVGLDGAIPNLNASNGRLQEGYAVTASNGGHRDPTRGPARFLDNPTIIDDYAKGAIIRTVLTAKAVIEAYYGQAPAYSYFEGCSSGGRSAFNAAANFPEQYDGIVAAAPTRNFAGAVSAWARASRQTVPSAAKLNAMYAAEVAQCDGADGLADGIIGNPAQCRFDLERLKCAAGVDHDNCLTRDEIDAVTTIRQDLTGTNGKALVYSRFGIGNPGAGLGVFMPLAGPGSPTFSSFLSTAFLGFVVFGDPTYDPTTYDVSRDYSVVEHTLEQVYDFSAETLPLAQYLRSGRKIIVWQGAEDTLLSHYDTIRAYHEMADAAGKKSDNARLYIAPGVNHCFGGPGADRFDMIAALRAWVESDAPPATLPAAKVDGTGNLLFTRPLCEYPRYPHFVGGDPNDASSFRCVGPGKH